MAEIAPAGSRPMNAQGHLDRSDDPGGVILSTLPAGRRDCRLALSVILVSGVLFVAAAPFAKVPLSPAWTFIPIYQSALVVNDLITAVLLFGQASISRSSALRTLASGYLFTAFMAVAHALTFPGLFAPAGLLGAGSQTTAWLYMFWHGGFPVFVGAYAILKTEGSAARRPPGHAGVAILTSLAAALGVVIGFTFLATAGQGVLPVIMRGHHYTPAMIFVVSTVWALSVFALIVLWWRRPHSVLDLWLMVVMVAWLFDIALAAVLNAGRFDLGFYAGRIYGLLAASFVLLLLLIENSALYARLVETLSHTRTLQQALQRQNEHLEAEVQARTRQLVETEKFATMGNLLAGVAHELNNPLSVILGQVALLVRKAPDEAVRARGHKLEQAATRCARIMKNFLAMARRHPPERASVTLNDVLRESVEILAYELRVANIEVTLELADQLPNVWADEHQLQQVAVNLLTNALHAMRDTTGLRRLMVATRHDVGNERVQIVIADTGPGMTADVRARIFEPLFTTKPEGQGTGLGLSICRGIVESHGGVIQVETAPGQGATFVIDLPLGTPPASAAMSRAIEAAPVVRGKRILVVDDEPEVADVLVEALTHDGHHVETASNGAAALAKLTDHPYDLILSDSGMPILSGIEFYQELRRRHPRLAGRVIFVTGDTLNTRMTEFLDSIDAPRLSKPFVLGDVQSLVRLVLHRLETEAPAMAGTL
jgi:two-component system sensor histidine kinase/response regulator